MSALCCFSCKNNSRENPSLSFFRFPKEEKRCKSWLAATKRMVLPKYTSAYCHKYLCMCSEHFPAYMFTGPLRKCLTTSAVPSIFEDVLSTVEIINCDSDSEEAEVSNAIKKPVTTKDSSLTNKDANTKSPCLFKISKPTTTTKTPVLTATETKTLTPAETQKQLVFILNNPVQLKRKAVTTTEKDPLSDDDTLGKVQEFLKEIYEPSLVQFVMTQLMLMNRDKDCTEYKQFALAIYFLNPKIYKFLSRTFCLPTETALHNIINKFCIQPSLSKSSFLMSILNHRNSFLSAKDRECVLCVNELPLKPHLFYNISKDTVIGYEEINGKKFFRSANVAWVFMLQGICNTKWEQPLGYFLLRDRCPTSILKMIICDAIKNTLDINFKIRALVCKQSFNFIRLTKILGVTETKPYFSVGTNKIYCIFDVPHLLTATRDGFFKNQIHVNDGNTDRNYLDMFYNSDKRQKFPLAPKLTDAHLNPKTTQSNKLKYASQIFSRTVVSALSTYVRFGALPPKAEFTINFIDKMDKLFDLLNSSMISEKNGNNLYKQPFTNREYQRNFLIEMQNLFKNMKLKDLTSRDLTGTFVFMSGWQLTINALLALYEDLREKDITTLYMRQFNLDCLRRFFVLIRKESENSRNPTPIQLYRKFKKLCCLHYIEKERANTVDDFKQLLCVINSAPIKRTFEMQNQNAPMLVDTFDAKEYIQVNFTEKNAFYDVASLILKKCLSQHSCDVCATYVKENTRPDHIQTYYKTYEHAVKFTYNPTSTFYVYLGACEHSFTKHFRKLSIDDNVGQKLKKILLAMPFLHPCTSFPVEYFVCLFIKTRIISTLTLLNRQSQNRNYLEIVRLL